MPRPSNNPKYPSQLIVSTTEATDKTIRGVAEQQNKSVSQVIREALETRFGGALKKENNA